MTLIRSAVARFSCQFSGIIFAAVFSCSGLHADELKSVFLIGNSLTWDTVPSQLGPEVKWHVDCGKSLPYIVEHPEAPCVKSSTLWPSALKNHRFDILVLQPHYGSTLTEDAKAISRLIELQPRAKVVIHTGWSRAETRTAEWSRDETIVGETPLSHSAKYFDALLETLRKSHPTRSFARTYAIDALQQLEQEIASHKAPIESIDVLYRDKIHMDLVTGRFLMHSLMRQAIGRPISHTGFDKLDTDSAQYLMDVVKRFKQAPASTALGSKPGAKE